MSDWYGTHSTADAANAGLDLEMPGPPQWFGPKLARRRARRRGRREAPRRHGRGGCSRSSSAPARSTTRDVRARGVRRRSRRPRRRAPRRVRAASCCCRTAAARCRSNDVATLAVDRPERRHRARDGRRQRARADPPLVSPLAGLRARFGDAVEIVHERGCTNSKITPPLDTRFLDGPLEVAYYAGREREGDPVLVEDAQRGVLHVDGPGRRRRARRLLGAPARHARCRPNRARGRSASCRPAARACCSTARWSSTTGTRPSAATRSSAWAARSSSDTVELVAGQPLRRRRRGDPRRARARRSVGRARAARRRRPDRPRGRSRATRRRGRVRRRFRRPVGDRGQRPRVDDACPARRTTSCARSRR